MCFHLHWLDLDEGRRRRRIRSHPECQTMIVLLCCFVDVVITRRTTTPLTTLRHGLTRDLMKDYEQVPPPGGATAVELGVYINSFYAISEQTMDYSLSIYLRQRWNDSRLQFDVVKYGLKPRIKLEDMWTRLWTPDVFFRNEKKASFHTVTTPNRLIFLHSTGTLWYVVKITTTLSCPMRLQKYPFDTQECPMIFESFGYKTDTIIFKWLPSPVEFEPDLELPQFFLVNYLLAECTQNSTAGLSPCLSITFTLQRNIGYYMIQLYIPSVLIVILSWVSFWLNVDAAPARVSIGLLTVLTTTTMSTAARDQLPRVSYIKAIDVWMSACLLFVFSSFLEYAVVSVFSRKRFTSSLTSPITSTTTMTTTVKATASSSSANFRTPTKAVARFTQKDVQLEMVQLKSETTSSSIDAYVLNNRTSPTLVQITRTSDGMGIARRIDRISRRVFPISFVSFNFIYWIVYNVNFTTAST